MQDLLFIYIFVLAAFTGYEVISRVPVILHTPLMSGSNFVHGVVLVGAMWAPSATPRAPSSSRSASWPFCSALRTRPAATSSPSGCWACSQPRRSRPSTKGKEA